MRPKFLTKQKQISYLTVGQVVIFKSKYTNYENKKFIVSKSTKINSYKRGIYLTDYDTGEEKYYSFLKENEPICLEDIYSLNNKIKRPYSYYIFKTNMFDDGKRFRTKQPSCIDFNPKDANISNFGLLLSLFKIVKIRTINIRKSNFKYVYSFNFFNPINLFFIPIYWFIVAIFSKEFNNSYFWNNFLFSRFFPYNLIVVNVRIQDFKRNSYYRKMHC